MVPENPPMQGFKWTMLRNLWGYPSPLMLTWYGNTTQDNPSLTRSTRMQSTRSKRAGGNPAATSATPRSRGPRFATQQGTANRRHSTVRHSLNEDAWVIKTFNNYMHNTNNFSTPAPDSQSERRGRADAQHRGRLRGETHLSYTRPCHNKVTMGAVPLRGLQTGTKSLGITIMGMIVMISPTVALSVTMAL